MLQAAWIGDPQRAKKSAGKKTWVLLGFIANGPFNRQSLAVVSVTRLAAGPTSCVPIFLVKERGLMRELGVWVRVFSFCCGG